VLLTAAGASVEGTAAICRYFAESQKGTPMLPKASLTNVTSWLEYDEVKLTAALSKRVQYEAAKPLLQPVEDALKANGGEWLVGKSITLADIMVWSTLYCSVGVQEDMDTHLKSELPCLAAWMHSAPSHCSALSLLMSVSVGPRPAPKKKVTTRLGDRFYITTAINYTNGVPHMGHAYEAVVTDVQARYHRMYGRETFFLTGADEHGQKIAESAAAKGITPQQSCDMYVNDHFKPLNVQLNISNDRYIRTTDPEHLATAQKLWAESEKNGDIYLAHYEGWYNVREETYVTEDDAREADYKDLVSGKPLEKKSEESYFFKMSRYHDWLVKHFEEHPEFLQPPSRYNEIMRRLKDDKLRDLSSSRKTFDWGVPILANGQPTKHVMYVWFDALTNYITGVDYCPQGKHGPNAKFWPATCHVIGKDIIWFHCVIWPCMLKSAGIPLPRTVFAHGFVKGSDGSKMSKSLGNVVDPVHTLASVSSDTFRWFIMRECTFGDDLTWSSDSMEQRHNVELADTFGNLVQRATSLCKQHDNSRVAACAADIVFDVKELVDDVEGAFAEFRLQDASEVILDAIRTTNKYITDKEPWKMKEDPAGRTKVVKSVLEAVYILAHFMCPFIPLSAQTIFERLNTPARTIKMLSVGFDNLTIGTEISTGATEEFPKGKPLFEKFEKKGK